MNRLSVSYGVVNRTEFPGASMVEIAKIADDRMYKNKSEFYKKAGIDRRRR